MERVTGLASTLLEGVYANGGYGFIEANTVKGAVPPPQSLAHKILMEWATERPELSTGDMLLQILKKHNPAVALRFASQLAW